MIVCLCLDISERHIEATVAVGVPGDKVSALTNVILRD